MADQDWDLRSRSFAELLVDESQDALMALSLDGRVCSWSRGARAMFGYTADEAIGASIDELTVPADRRDEARCTLAQAVETGSATFQTTRLHKNGTMLDVDVSMRRIDGADGSIIAVSKKDVSALRRLQAVEAASRLKSEFLANMSHELRTPLNAIIGFTELMHNGKVGPVSAEHREYLGDILHCSKHLLQLINDVLDLSKVEAGKVEFRPEPVSIATLIEEVRDVVRGLASSKRLHIDTTIDPSVSSVHADPARLKQILLNYLSNAIKFTPDEGHVHIRVLGAGADRFKLEVEDTGVGIPEPQLRKLFVEFQQLDARSARKYQGTGLGLALTKRLTEAQGGRVFVRSTPGVGSTFGGVLPRSLASVRFDRVTTRAFRKATNA
jgi:PAS domain S-box-containing protein